ncbi:deoxyhypusine synthase [Pararhizobium capsulatum DSM 1112]|uniref:Deoxyhypusine synthase n=1 Tax=Pararhizobium capsulatum DSM 1112 TaxID=1121113 RepID=A0ABU0BYR8_9HYPH|nr:hypothetical protein [Pararhizobium capsulatum]MDQ0323399.1 deoxyhypusine synthase [Pararhizobium capsulatum DSM 1112]
MAQVAYYHDSSEGVILYFSTPHNDQLRIKVLEDLAQVNDVLEQSLHPKHGEWIVRMRGSIELP